MLQKVQYSLHNWTYSDLQRHQLTLAPHEAVFSTSREFYNAATDGNGHAREKAAEKFSISHTADVGVYGGQSVTFRGPP